MRALVAFAFISHFYALYTSAAIEPVGPICLRGCPGSGTTLLTRVLEKCYSDRQIISRDKHLGCSLANLDSHGTYTDNNPWTCGPNGQFVVVTRNPLAFKRIRSSGFGVSGDLGNNLRVWNGWHAKWMRGVAQPTEFITYENFTSNWARIFGSCADGLIDQSIAEPYIEQDYIAKYSENDTQTAHELLSGDVLAFFNYTIELQPQ